MIRIIYPKQAPEILRTKGARKRAKHCADYLANKAQCEAGTRRFAFDAAIYGHKTVKDALVLAQHKKCCFCERMTGDDGDVEHFRPKSGWRQTVGGKLNQPGYYWLGYEWSNLFISCSACNQRHKRNLFPLVDTTKRATCHTDSIVSEAPLFINPAGQDPEVYIGFRYEIPFAIKGNRYGKATIQALGLDREILNEVRRERLAQLVLMQKIVDLTPSLVATAEGKRLADDAITFIELAVTDAGEFASMSRAAARNGFVT